MPQDKKVTAEVVEHVKKLSKGDIVSLFAEKNSFKDPETGAPLSLSAETLNAIVAGEFDHLLKEEKKNGEKKGLKEKLKEKMEQTSEKKEELATDTKSTEDSPPEKEEQREKKTDEPTLTKEEEKPVKKINEKIKKHLTQRGKNVNLDELKKRSILALCILCPLLGLSIYYQEQILQTLGEVAKSFAIVSAVIAALFIIPLAMDPSLKKGFRVVGLLFVAIGFYLIYLGGAFFNGLLALAIGAMIFMLTF